MNGYFIVGIAAGILGMAIGGGAAYTFEGSRLSAERATHSNDAAQYERNLSSMSKSALDAQNAAILQHNASEARIAALDAQITQEKVAHDADNAKNRAAIADGARRLRVAVTGYSPTGSNQNSTSSGSSSVVDGASGTAYLSPAYGSAIFSIADDADSDARAKTDYLQQYVCDLQQQGVIAGSCTLKGAQ